jgi:hypothetical protein
MKYILGISLIIISSMAWASTDSAVLISGTIGNSYNENEVKIIDSLEQTMLIPSRLFPKGFKFTQGTSFSIEVPEAELNNIKKIK